MQKEKLLQNIIDMIEEQQIKLGYAEEAIRLYYPLSSLNRILGTALETDGMQKVLAAFSAEVLDTLGSVEISHEGERFCLLLSPDAQRWVHAHMEEKSFLRELIETISRHGCTMEEVLNLFHRHSDRVCVEPKTGEDFDVLVYFADGEPDAYRYCLTDEGCHIIYHRFTAEDYFDFYPEG